jgi:hypothetical protein
MTNTVEGIGSIELNKNKLVDDDQLHKRFTYFNDQNPPQTALAYK